MNDLKSVGRKIEENAKKAADVTKMVDEAKRGLRKAMEEAQ